MHSSIVEKAVGHANRAARKSTMTSSHGCIVIFIKGPRRGEILTSAYNKLSKRVDHIFVDKIPGVCISLHAEMIASHRIPKHLVSKVIIVVVRINKKRDHLSSKPCKSCEKIIRMRKLTILYS